MERQIGFNQEASSNEPTKMEGDIGNSGLGEKSYGNALESDFDLRILKTIEFHMIEREKILTNKDFTDKQKLKYLENNRKSLIMSTGGHIIRTESIAWALLVSTSVITLTLAFLTAFTSFPKEVFLGISGPLFGGTLVTIASKLSWK